MSDKEFLKAEAQYYDEDLHLSRLDPLEQYRNIAEEMLGPDADDHEVDELATQLKLEEEQDAAEKQLEDLEY